MSAFQIKVETKGGIALVKVGGYLDAKTFEQMEEALNKLFESSHYKIIIDLSSVDYISSAGAGVFIGAISTAQENEGNIILLNPTDNVKEVFDLLGLSQIFKFASGLEEAKHAF
ncbi:MAG: STAS domain-containing protein [Planctomycetota bacterium]